MTWCAIVCSNNRRERERRAHARGGFVPRREALHEEPEIYVLFDDLRAKRHRRRRQLRQHTVCNQEGADGARIEPDVERFVLLLDHVIGRRLFCSAGNPLSLTGIRRFF